MLNDCNLARLPRLRAPPNKRIYPSCPRTPYGYIVLSVLPLRTSLPLECCCHTRTVDFSIGSSWASGSASPPQFGSMSIKACSQLEEVIVGKPKDLFRRFQRLGIYEWRDVFSAAKNDISNDIVAFRFRMTERFKVPVNMMTLEPLDIRGPFMSPRRISEAHFATIYQAGCGLI
jgi:hypothetical protein